MAAAFAPSEGRSGELQILRGEVPPLHPATGFVIGTAVSGLFWLAIGFACYLTN
jgi:hypothetical protein